MKIIMWIFTNFGFYSVVRHREKADILVVRGRSVHDMRSLIKRHGYLLGQSEADIILTPEADYCCRIFVNDYKWSDMLAKVTQEIDYDNFKHSVQDQMGTDRAGRYMDIWSIMHRLQSSELNKKFRQR